MSGVYESPDVNISKYNRTIFTGDTSDRPQGLACKLWYSLMYLDQNLSRQPSESVFGTTLGRGLFGLKNRLLGQDPQHHKFIT